MKQCKFCNADLPEGSSVCPSCGKENARGHLSATVMAITAAVAVLVLCLGALFAVRQDASIADAQTTTMSETLTDATEEVTEEATEAPTEAPTVPADGNPDDVTCKGTYTADDEAVVAARDTIVATAGDYELTQGQLQVYYWMGFRNFMSQYGAYAAYFGLDVSQSLDTQMYTLSEPEMTWQQFFLQSALNSWLQYQTIAGEADAQGYELTEEQKDILANAAAEVEATALEYGYESGDDMLHSSLGAAASLEDYVYFMELYYKANGYYSEVALGLEPTDEQMEAYYAEHADGYTTNGITKDGKYVDVRHILICPEDTDETNEESWSAAEEKAQALLDEFLAGEATEELFAELANANSEDPGSNTTGGLYENVTEGQMVEAFNDWCFDDIRQMGDTGIVKTNYGYHIMYFSGSTPIWEAYVRSDYISEKANEIADEIAGRSPLNVNYGDILIANSVIQ